MRPGFPDPERPLVVESKKRLSIGARAALRLLRGYKLIVSPHLGANCRYVPSCADYARDAIILHGAIRGSRLALGRFLRCHPLFAGGFDPVPTDLDRRVR